MSPLTTWLTVLTLACVASGALAQGAAWKPAKSVEIVVALADLGLK